MDALKSEQLWNQPDNWTCGVLYRCAEDPRWIVPMRFTNAAWTPNVAHRRAVQLAVAILAAAAAPAAIAGMMGRLHVQAVVLGCLLWCIACVLPVGVLARYRSV